MDSNLLILGAGQYGAVVREIAESMGCFDRIDFLDDNVSDISIGRFSDCEHFTSTYHYAVVAVGNIEIRNFWFNKLIEYGYTLPVLIHRNAFVSKAATIGDGCVIEPFSVIQANVSVGHACLICSGAVLKHNCTVGDTCYIDCNSTVMPEATVPSGTRVNCNEVYFFRN